MKMVMFQKLNENAVIPYPAHDTDAGYDLASVEEVTIPVGGRAIVGTGLAVALPEPREVSAAWLGYPVNVVWEAQVRPRSGNAYKKGLSVLNTPGTIDAGYRGEIKVILINHGEEPVTIRPGDKIAQLVFNLVVQPEITVTEDLPESDRGAKGFGSTGVVDQQKG
jgi:dUTP pyrophosphatase